MRYLQIVLMLVLITSILHAQEGEWTAHNNGLNSQVVYTIVAHPENPDILYAGTDEGFCRTENGGANWQSSDGLPVRAIWVSNDGGTILIAKSGGSRSDGIWISQNGGNNFELLHQSWILYPSAIAVNPENENHIFIGSLEQGFRFSLNSGSNWQEANNGLNGAINHISVKNVDDETYLFTSTAEGLFRCQVGNNIEWEEIGPHGLPAAQTAFSFEENDGVFTGTNDESDSDGLYYSDNFGDDWEVSLWGHYVQAVETAPELVVMASTEVGVHRSTDGGDNWTEMNEELDDFDITDLLIQTDEEEITIYCSTNGSGIFSYIIGGEPQDHPPSEFNLLHPTDGDPLESLEVTFDWEDSEDPDEDENVTYQWWIGVEDDSLSIDNLEASELEIDLDALNIDLPVDVAISWWVVAVSGDLQTECNERFTFLIPPEDEPPSAFSLLNPEDGAHLGNQPVTFGWGESEDPDSNEVVTYEWWIGRPRDSLSVANLETNELTLTLDTLNINLTQGEVISWWVKAVSGDFQTECEARFSFWYLPGAVIENNGIITDFRIYPASPNPFNASTTLHFDLNSTKYLKLAIYDLYGREITVLANGRFETGKHSITWNASDAQSGIYLASFNYGNTVQTVKLMLIR
ncbi:MAG: T9SS type A sorting domain-containing protein [Candidatus Hatepunaea meridiana]|nr:T9SS type A sorting domain-containing protein [Candidatus Hatepunaea meridiana]